jgi:hypothetical protein
VGLVPTIEMVMELLQLPVLEVLAVFILAEPQAQSLAYLEGMAFNKEPMGPPPLFLLATQLEGMEAEVPPTLKELAIRMRVLV